jgi:hypothetical protein
MLYKRATLIQDIKEIKHLIDPVLQLILEMNVHMGFGNADQIFLWIIQHYIEKMDGRQIKGHLFRDRHLEDIYAQLNNQILCTHNRTLENLLQYYIQIPSCLYQFQVIELAVEMVRCDLYIYFLHDELYNLLPNLTNDQL